MTDARPVHTRPAALALVAVGGTVGTLARYGLELALGTAGPIPAATLTANLTGAFLLGLLLAWLGALGPDAGGRRAARLLVGTGLLGGYTTYSTFALQTVRWAAPGPASTAGAAAGVTSAADALAAAGYGVLGLAAGLVLAVLGLAVGEALGTRRRVRAERTR